MIALVRITSAGDLWSNLRIIVSKKVVLVHGVNYILGHHTADYSVSMWLKTTDGVVVGNLCGFNSKTGKPAIGV